MSILNAVSKGGRSGLTLTEVARKVALGEPTTLRYLSSLKTHECVIRDMDTGRYTLGMKLFLYGQLAVRANDIQHIALPHMEQLLERYRETVNLGAWLGSRLLIIDVLESTQSVRRGATIGNVDEWCASSLGKSILAELDIESALTLAAGTEWTRHTKRTITNNEDLIADLARIKERGYAIDDEEFEDGLRCVGVAIHDHRGRPTYTMSISGVATRMSLETTHQMGLDLLVVARAISNELGNAHHQEEEK